MKWPMRAFAITGMLTVCMISRIFEIGAMRATPPSLRMSAGTRSRAITAVAPAFSAICACAALVTSMMTPPFNISASPTFTRNVSSRYITLLVLNHRGCGLDIAGAPQPFQFACENISERPDATLDFLRRQAGKAQSQRARLVPLYGEKFSGQIRHTFPLRARQLLTGIQRLGQPHPQVHAPLRPGEARSFR